MYDDSAIHLGEQFSDYLNKLAEENAEHKLTVSDIFWMIYTVVKGKIWTTFLLFLGEMSFKLAFSVILQFLFQYVSQGDKERAYILAFFGGFSWLLSQMFRHNAFYQSPIIGARLRAGLVAVLFAKLSALSQFTLKSS
jgi:hypothetical protein